MKKVIIKNKLSEVISEADFMDPSEWIQKGIFGNWWGKPERWVPHKDEQVLFGKEEYDDADVIDEREVEIIPAKPFEPAIPAVYEGGVLIRDEIPESPEKPAVMQKQVKLKAEYLIEIIDITESYNQAKTNEEALKYLAETDWMIIREVDSGVPCPAEIKQKRQEARESIVK
jgi:hypothetical protein